MACLIFNPKQQAQAFKIFRNKPIIGTQYKCLANMTEQQNSDATLIRAARTVQTAAIASGDFDAVASFWTEDITVRRALGPPVNGVKEALAALTPDNDAPLIYQREAVSVEVSTHWPFAFEEGRWSGHPDNVQTAPVISGRYAAQWVKQDGRWLIRSEVFVALTKADLEI